MNMAEYPVLSRAPIVEALLTIRVEPLPRTAVESLRNVGGEGYSLAEARFAHHIQFEIDPSAGTQEIATSRQADGYLFRSPDGTKVAQAFLSGIALSQLKPYKTWGDLAEQAKRLWTRYVEITGERKITALGLRYVNRIELQNEDFDVSRYLRTAPDLPVELSKDIDNFFLRIRLPRTHDGLTATFTETFGALTDSGTVPLLFDIDVERRGPFDPSDEELWQIFSSMRALKNRIFFRSITEEVVELCR